MKLERSIGRALIAAACVLLLTFSASGTARAAATKRIYKAGNAPIGKIVCVGSLCLAPGTMLQVIDGTDYGDSISLNYVRAQVTGLNICNWWVDFDFEQDPSKHIQGEFHRGCTKNGYVRHDLPLPNVYPVGRACATLWENAIRRSKQCHSLP